MVLTLLGLHYKGGLKDARNLAERYADDQESNTLLYFNTIIKKGEEVCSSPFNEMKSFGYFTGLITSSPPIYGRKTSGTTMLPSSC